MSALPWAKTAIERRFASLNQAHGGRSRLRRHTAKPLLKRTAERGRP